jgi:hypothetical protein
VLTSSKIIAGGLASATTAVLGSYFGVLGTVGAAAATSVVSAVSSEVFQRSIDRTTGRLRSRDGAPVASGAEPDRPRPVRRRSALPAIIFGSVVIFVLGIGVVSGIEYARGAPLSGGSRGTSIGDLLHGTLSPVTERVPVVGGLLGTNSEPGDSNDSTGSTDSTGRQRKDRQQPGLINGLLSGL